MPSFAEHLTLLSVGAAGVIIVTFALYGWGRLTRDMANLPVGAWPVTTALGLACVLFIGGLLNLCRCAYPLALCLVLLVGCMLAVFALRRKTDKAREGTHRSSWITSAVLGATIVALTALAIAAQLAPTLYNGSDDFQEYFAHAIRMVETGTLYGSPINGLGGEGFGGQAFLQGFIVGFFPLRFINGADAVFCFYLCLVLAAGVAIGRPALAPAALIGVLSVFVIEPQYVNISSLFSTAAMVSAIVIVSADPRERGDGNAPGWRAATPVALLYAGAIALKPTVIVFIGLHFVIATAAALWLTHDWRRNLAHAGRVATWTVVFLGPWLLLYSPYYMLALTVGRGQTVIPLIAGGHVTVHPLSLLSPTEIFYGGSRLAYTCVALALSACAVHATMRARREFSVGRARLDLASAALAAAGTYFFWVLVGPHLQETDTTLRYSVPVLIGATSAALSISAIGSERGGKMLAGGLAAALVLLFAPAMRQRVGMLLHQGTELSYMRNWDLRAIDGGRRSQVPVLDGQIAAEVRSLQDLVPTGESLLVWTNTPFLFDYHRNTVIEANVAGFGQAWGRIPPTRYVLWQYSGVSTAEDYRREMRFGRRSGELAARALDAFFWFRDAAKVSEVIADRNGMILFRVKPKALPAPG
jgi:hypothetical protein